MSKKVVINNKNEKNNYYNLSQTTYTSNKDKMDKIHKTGSTSNMTISYDKKSLNSNNKRKNNSREIISESKTKEFTPIYSNQNYKLKLDNNKYNYNKYISQNSNRESSTTTESKYNNNQSYSSRNFSVTNINKKNNLNRSMKNIQLTSSLPSLPNNNIVNKNFGFDSDFLKSKNSNKLNMIKDDYINFLQKQFEDNTINNVKLDSNNKELLKKCDNLIHDNQLLNKTLKERNNELSKIVQENLNIKTELDKAILNNQKNEQKLIFYEEQFNLYKSSNENYQKIIKELKDQNEKINSNFNQYKTTNEENQRKSEEKYKKEIEELKKNLNNKIQNGDKNYENKIKALNDEIKTLKEKNNELTKELKAKENVMELMYKDNEKLTNQNNLNNIQLEQNMKQIKDLKNIIQQKEDLIISLKTKEIENEKMFFTKSNSSLMKFENSDYINENITKLICDNEENRMKIEYLNDKLKTIGDIEKKYYEFMKVKKEIPTEKISINASINAQSPDITSRDKRYNNKNHNFFSSNNNKNNKVPKKIEKHEIKNLKSNLSVKQMDFKGRDKKPTHLVTNTLPLNSTVNNTINRNDNRNKRINEINEYKNKSQIVKDNNDKNKSSIQIKNTRNTKNEINQNIKGKGIKNIEINLNNISSRERKVYKNEDIKINAFKKQNSFESIDKKVYHGKKMEEPKDEIKNSIREMDRKKNFSYIPKVHNYSEDEAKTEQKNNDKKTNNQNKIEKNKGNKNKLSYYLFGIDRNDFFHMFDINNKVWVEKKKILDIKLEDKSDSFKKDYQYEGTLLYNTLEGLYILTGEKTDTLYYFNPKKNSISKICKFNNCHDNGSIMYDKKSNNLYVFGGRKITACEYYSFSTKKIYKLPDLIIDRANASFIISNNKIYGFFGFSYLKDYYANTIEYIDYNKKDKWVELDDIKLLKNNIKFDIESSSTMYYKQNNNQILIYSGIQGNNEDFITQYYLLYDTKNNTMDKLNKWNLNQYKYIGNDWKKYEMKINDPKGFHFAKNSRFILMPKNATPEGYNVNDIIDILIDYKNNVHFINQDKQKIDIYRGEI